MTRDEYVSNLQVVIDYQAQLDALAKSLTQHLARGGQEVCISLGDEVIGKMLDLIEAAVGDEACGKESGFGSWTRWYLWEVSPGNRECIIGGKLYTVRSTADLYDVITAWKELKHKHP